MTQEEFEERERQLAADIKTAYAAFNQARDYWDGLCAKRRDLHWAWMQQHKNGGNQ